MGMAMLTPSDNLFNSVLRFTPRWLMGEKSVRLYRSTTNLARPFEMLSGVALLAGGSCVMYTTLCNWCSSPINGSAITRSCD